MNPAILTLVITVANVIAMMLTKYLTNYSTEKAKNQATKEDIAEITTIAETIRVELAQQTEQLKSQLSLSTSHQLSLKSAERDALFNFDRTLSEWIAFVLRCDVGKFNLDNHGLIKKELDELQRKQIAYDIAADHLILFMHDQEFLNLRRDLNIGIVDLEFIVRTALINCYHTCKIDAVSIYCSGDVVQKEMLKRELINKLHSIVMEATTERNEQFKKVHLLRVPLQKLIYERLKAISVE